MVNDDLQLNKRDALKRLFKPYDAFVFDCGNKNAEIMFERNDDTDIYRFFYIEVFDEYDNDEETLIEEHGTYDKLWQYINKVIEYGENDCDNSIIINEEIHQKILSELK